ncbi:hypothetical protein PYCCODRAFT_814200 [Trametes coccinea BRFM310]|uniref:Uncharacterized protein n=1 Tax=Trametes coccinea (strain BRFM310) TaxID=1353009 RepID=A0A1Y2IEH3_TRAC3|nr:hypothetical protein PYCCODRAFT_814200 [Trametes coccinea BRFM310]
MKCPSSRCAWLRWAPAVGTVLRHIPYLLTMTTCKPLANSQPRTYDGGSRHERDDATTMDNGPVSHIGHPANAWNLPCVDPPLPLGAACRGKLVYQPRFRPSRCLLRSVAEPLSFHGQGQPWLCRSLPMQWRWLASGKLYCGPFPLPVHKRPACIPSL